MKRYDPECAYVKKWIPELASVPAKDILGWETKYKGHLMSAFGKKCQYVKPIVDHKTSSVAGKSMLKGEDWA